MTTPTNNAQVTVAQADREAAADLFLEIFSGGKSARHAARLLREGKGDKGSGGVQAFARHRIAAQAEAAREVEALREALVTARREMRRAVSLIMAVETNAMHGDNLAVTLCTYFSDHDESGTAEGDDGWSDWVTDQYEDLKQAIEARFAACERVFDNALTTKEPTDEQD